MAIVKDGLDSVVEWEMTVNQRGFVDNCFEEGQHETGIALLDSLRSPTLKPFPPYIRQLLYLALYPPFTPSPETEESKHNFDLGVPSSPSKLAARQHRSILSPTPAVSEAAQDILMAFAQTNSPESLFRALPSYVLSDIESGANNSVHAVLDDDEEDDDSPLARQSTRMKEVKNCWEILKEGFIQPRIDVPVSPRVRSRSRRHHADDDDDDDFSTTPPDLHVVGPHAWPVLEWMIVVFEKDEFTRERNHHSRYSPLLLARIPPSRTTGGGRWEVATPLDIVLHCLRQEEEEHRLLGVRLMTLLINLTNSEDLNINMFLTAASSRLSSFDSEQISFLFTRLPWKSLTVMECKLVLCRGLLMDPTSGVTSNSSTRPKPTFRAQPRSLASRRKRSDSVAENGATAAGNNASDPKAVSTSTRKFPLTTSSDILRLLASSHMASSDLLLSLWIKDELVRNFVIIQLWSAESNRDPGWTHVLESGQLIQAVQQSFATRSRSQELTQQVEDLKVSLLSFVETAAYQQANKFVHE
ncbi:unnamed protein product [Somion occarium]|uniref:Uncharacterized protein n=1 Tax=Somion occarium TaxID=3059160 RepID=A0ABP1DIJ5_9APHY